MMIQVVVDIHQACNQDVIGLGSTQTKSMVTPDCMPDFDSYVETPFGDLRYRFQSFMISTSLSASASWSWLA